MRRQATGQNVFDAAVGRMRGLYAAGHRVVVSFSAGKDSGVALEVCVIAARLEGRLPVDVVMRDEEIMLPGTYEYADRVYRRPEIAMRWISARQPIINIFNREQPYFWVFDLTLPSSAWVRQPPAQCEFVREQNIEHMSIPSRFPPPPGKDLIAVLGMRVQESKGRLFGLYNLGGFLSKRSRMGERRAWPIYDWTDGDVWKAIHDFKWDYNEAYDVMNRLGVSKRRLRIAPPTMNAASVPTLKLAAQAWPRWFGAVCRRLPGVRTAAMFGLRAVQPQRRHGETWQDCFERECLQDAPEWIRQRAEVVKRTYLRAHARHSREPLPQVTPCEHCTSSLGSWKVMAMFAYNGDPFSQKFTFLPYVDPGFFRPGAGTWGGKPTW